MVLAELGGSISRALQQMRNATVVDEKVLNDCLNEINRALLQADVQFQLVRDMTRNNKNIVNFGDLPAGHNKRKIIQQAVFSELCKILDPGRPSFTPKRRETSVVMFVGLQGSGKTTTCTKYAYCHKQKGWNPALVCADTSRAGAFDQLKQNATKAKIPFFGSINYAESDPVKVAVDGVETFKKEKCDLIIVDTSGRHRQEAALFEEMRQVSEAIKPDLVIFVMDSSIGQAAFDQALAFTQSVAVGAVIVTKMDGHAKGGVQSSFTVMWEYTEVAATKSPVTFIGTGEHIDEFEVFDVKPFVSRLLGMGDWSGFMDKLNEVVLTDQQPELLQKLSQGKPTLRIMYELFQCILKMGPIGQGLSMLFGADFLPKGNEKEIRAKFNGYLTLMDSMTNEGNSNPKLMNQSRIMRIARGAGRRVHEVIELLEGYKRLANTSKNKSLMKGLNQMGGAGGLQNIIKHMSSIRAFNHLETRGSILQVTKKN
ncbi:signal recognition particle 54 kda protein 2 [Nicotiana attenuata]|uniref:Signal recognition particle 54 kDa protein n=1 Tax=Nicotiana attenuata TaxID=49451 RepID=A0A314LFN7_NICAT|nr:signal recognition particle 54 kda protein 2 [Nicotiana attenuata]